MQRIAKRFFRKYSLNLIVIFLFFICGVIISSFAFESWIVVFIALVSILIFGLYGLLFSRVYRKNHSLSYISVGKVYLTVIAQIFIFVPWRLRPIDVVMNSSRISLFGLDFIRVMKLVIMLVIFVITLPSVVKFIKRLKKLRSFFVERALFLFFLLSIVFIFLRVTFSPDFSLYNYYVPFQSYISLASLIWITDFGNFSEKQKEFAYEAIMVGAIIFISIMLLLYLFKRELVFPVSPTTGIGRLGGIIISPNSLAAFAAVVSIYSFSKIITKPYPKKEYMFFLLSTYALILIRSTAAFIEVFGVLLILLFIKKRFIALNVILIVVVMIFSIYFKDIIKFVLRSPSLHDYFTSSTLVARLHLWENSIKKFFSLGTVRSLLIGVGFGLKSFAFFYNLDYWHPNFAHNVFVQKLVEGGILYLALLLSFLFLLIVFGYKSWKRSKGAIYLSFIGIFIYAFAGSSGGDGFFGFVGIVMYVLLYFIVSTLRCAMNKKTHSKRKNYLLKATVNAYSPYS